MRISDWSSDVCSSDLRRGPGGRARRGYRCRRRRHRRRTLGDTHAARFHPCAEFVGRHALAVLAHVEAPGRVVELGLGLVGGRVVGRSEEHTSELQSQMRMSYPVFCLKKKNNYIPKN